MTAAGSTLLLSPEQLDEEEAMETAVHLVGRQPRDVFKL
jgi:hypothetical protein